MLLSLRGIKYLVVYVGQHANDKMMSDSALKEIILEPRSVTIKRRPNTSSLNRNSLNREL
jgi:hypothetical protein